MILTPARSDRVGNGRARAQGGVERVPWGFLEFFAISQTVLPALLYLPGTQPLRVLIRVGAYGISLAALVWWMSVGRKVVGPHPSRPWLLGALAYVALQVFHPATNSVLAGTAQIALYLGVMAPVFWAPDVIRGREQLRRLIAILLVCNGVNAVVGILQVYDPEHWMPREYTTVAAQGHGVMALSYIGPDGKRIIRPPGLSDSPGAVCGAAASAALLGLIFCADASIVAWKRVGALGFAFAGMAAIYLTQVRSSLIVVVTSVLIYSLILCLQREQKRMTAFLVLGVSVMLSGLSLAAVLGGNAVVDRFSTLFEEDPGSVYYRSRGGQIDYAFRIFAERYPLGAGLGRWGMMRYYFGDEHNAASPPIWAEIQFPAWLLDGGIVLLVQYSLALVWTGRQELFLACRSPDPSTRSLAATIFAVNIGTLALLFSYVPFHAPVGQQYWFLAGALHGATGGNRRDKGVAERPSA